MGAQLRSPGLPVASQVPLSMGFPRQEHWNRVPFAPPPGDLPNPKIKPTSPVAPALLMTDQRNTLRRKDMKEGGQDGGNS